MIMIKRISLILAVVMLALAGQAQLLWKVSGNGLGRPSYIFGTHHMAPSSMIDQIPGMETAIEGCDIVVGEIEKDSLLAPEVQARMAQHDHMAAQAVRVGRFLPDLALHTGVALQGMIPADGEGRGGNEDECCQDECGAFHAGLP